RAGSVHSLIRLLLDGLRRPDALSRWRLRTTLVARGTRTMRAIRIAKPNAMTKTPRIFNLPVLVGLIAFRKRRWPHLSELLLLVDPQKLDAIWLLRVIRSDERTRSHCDAGSIFLDSQIVRMDVSDSYRVAATTLCACSPKPSMDAVTMSPGCK